MKTNNDESQIVKAKMDKRCPRKLEHHPCSFCPLAVLRLKQLRNAGHELTEEEESNLPGCPWAINHQMSDYCFFKFAAEYLDSGNPPTDIEIAHMNSVSTDTIKKSFKLGLEKIKQSDMMQEINESYNGDGVLDSTQESDPEYEIKYR